jgi:translation initiation factor 4A
MSKGFDIVAQSQSGTGKTGAFTIGALTRVDCTVQKVQLLILEPTKELATQSFKVLSQIGRFMGVNVQCSIGGLPVGQDIAAYRKGLHAVVGTPGRVIDLIRRGNFSPEQLKVLVVDEADEMLSAGFQEAIQEILREIPTTCQVVLFSATLPPETLEITSRFMKDPIRITLDREHVVLDGIMQYYVDVGEEEYKLATLEDLFSSVSVSQCIIFCNSRRKADWLCRNMLERDFPVACIHSDMSSEERIAVMDAFIVGRSRVLIATDLLARGIDVQGVGFVVNYDLTRNFENYIHRIGRGGRFGRKGVAINFVTAQERVLLKQLCQYYNRDIPQLPSDFALPE